MEELLRAVCAISLMQPENAANGAGGSAAACAPPQGPPDHFICPISLDIMQDPVIVVQSGITYERALIEQAMRFNPCRDPATNQEWSEPLTLAPNVLVRKMIREWQEQAPPPASQSSSRQVEPSSPPRSAARSDQIEQLNTRMRIEQSRGETPDTVEARRVARRSTRMAAARSRATNLRGVCIAWLVRDGGASWLRSLVRRYGRDISVPRHNALAARSGVLRLLNGRADAATALADMKTDAGRKAIIAANGIPPLIQMITDGPPASKTEAARALMSIMAIGEGQVAVARAGGIAPLVELATTGTVAAKEQAAGALRNLSITADNRVPLVQAGCVDPLVELSKTGTNARGIRRRLFGRSRRPARAPRHCRECRRHRAVSCSARSGNNVIKENAAGALRRISIENSANQQEIAGWRHRGDGCFARD